MPKTYSILVAFGTPVLYISDTRSTYRAYIKFLRFTFIIYIQLSSTKPQLAILDIQFTIVAYTLSGTGLIFAVYIQLLSIESKSVVYL